MATLNWGDLTKNQVDPETIEQAIERIIEQHNNNEEAHLDTGQSLQSHKASEIIDHLAESIVADKIGDGQINLEKLTAENHVIISALESLDCWLHNITASQEIGSLVVNTGATINTTKYMYSTISGPYGLDWNKDFFYQTTIKCAYNTNQEIYFGVGTTEYIEGYSGAGFKIINGTLYAGTIKNVDDVYIGDWQAITGITITNVNVYRVKYDHTAGALYFFINGVLKRTISSNLPTNPDDSLATYQIKNTAASAKYIVIYDFIYQRQR